MPNNLANMQKIPNQNFQNMPNYQNFQNMTPNMIPPMMNNMQNYPNYGNINPNNLNFGNINMHANM